MTDTKQKLTDEQKKTYLTDSGRCPICKSSELEGQGYDYDGDQVWQTIVCQNPNCRAAWRDVFTLTFIEDIDTRIVHVD
jgi:C4-type Zn-finger protein